MKKYIICVAVLFFFFLGASTGFAQNAISVSMRPDGLKSVSKGRSIALTNTLSPMAMGMGTVALTENNTLETMGAALGVYGLIMGPSTGNFYANDYKRGGFGMAVRGVGAFLMADATREIFGDDFADALMVDDKKVSLTDTKVLIGEVLVLGSIIYNVVTVEQSVQQFNETQARFTLQLDSETIQDKVAPLITAKFRL